MSKLEHFSVQILGEYLSNAPHCVPGDAAGPVQAAQIAIGDVLSMQGNRRSARAIAWRLTDDFSQIGITL